jgi:hypothetical protein
VSAFGACPTDLGSTASGILEAVSDGYIRLIPTDLDWQPTPEAAASAVAYVARLFSGPDDAVEEVNYEFYDRATLIDAGENTTQITCSRCDEDISLEWFYDLVEENMPVARATKVGCTDLPLIVRCGVTL